MRCESSRGFGAARGSGAVQVGGRVAAARPEALPRSGACVPKRRVRLSSALGRPFLRPRVSVSPRVPGPAPSQGAQGTPLAGRALCRGAQPRLLLPGEAAGAGFEPWTVLPRAGERQGLTAGGGGQTRGPVPRPGTEMKSDVANDGRVLIS